MVKIEGHQRKGIAMALQILINEKCKDCKVSSCMECLYLGKALDTVDEYDCKLIAYMTSDGHVWKKEEKETTEQ